MEQLPEKWVIRQSTSEEVCKWFRQFRDTNNAKTSGTYQYLFLNGSVKQKSRSAGYTDRIPAGFVELTEQEFKRFVLNEKIEEEPEKPDETEKGNFAKILAARLLEEIEQVEAGKAKVKSKDAKPLDEVFVQFINTPDYDNM